MNKVFFMGRLVKDVEFNKEKKYARFTIAVNEKVSQEKTNVYYINHISFGNLAETISKYLKKGSKVLVEGKLVQNQEKREQISVVVENIQFLDGKSQDKEEFPF